MPELSRLVDELLCTLVAFDPDELSGDDCAALARQLARAGKACETASTRAAVRASECGRVSRPADFLAQVNGTTNGAARTAIEAVCTAPAATRDALVAGDVSLAQAAAIASVPAHEGELLALAREKGLGAVKDAARKHRLAGIDPEVLHEKQVEAQHFRSWTNDLGNVAFEGELPPEVGVPFVRRLDAETDRLWRASSKADRAKPREWHAARGFAQMVSAKGSGKKSGCDFVVVFDLNAYRAGAAPAHIVGGGPIPVSVARELAKDAFLKAVLHDGVNIHTVAHFGRYRPAVLQTALDLGAPPEFDGTTCTDCGRRFHLQWDHVDPCANGGATSYENLGPKCPPCHTEKTERDRRAGLLGARVRAPDRGS